MHPTRAVAWELGGSWPILDLGHPERGEGGGVERVLVSACLLGQRVRYDGEGFEPGDLLLRWQGEGRTLALCPEQAGGLAVPRPPAEIEGGQGGSVLAGDTRVITRSGADLSDAFIRGAEAALALCRREGVRMAVLKARSPSCGNRESYDGSFTGVRVSGQGVTAALLMREGVRVFNEQELEDAERYLQGLESLSG
ncbi:DUF523 domain-containing protein [Aestuariirhabdus litorea]|uniref:DUF523 domain-containing protein n=1 Tax=Aestuariirhabdus litorea TaxID=2528527 RepID=A0A3P3VLD8_9GAMM|nr:DUF523 domain-containing protein [Aestuariirhabdus litorea]RRJ83555.1 DUF523 domain-containing protein [Aestuariirhabdus litorea]RWW96776.1 DUF523 domain-containing protein [Endozoicomonadaceae bacterium GTF-13]